MHFYLKRIKSYASVIFFADEDDIRHPYIEGEVDPDKKNALRRYIYYTMEDLCIVNDATGCYEWDVPMPKPFSIPGKIYWRLLHIWQTKIVKTHI